jgi:hypothetical protein
MKSFVGRMLVSSLALGLLLTGACNNKQNISSENQNVAASTQAASKPTKVKEAPKPEIRIASFSGAVEFQKGDGDWTAVTTETTLEIKDSLRVGADGKLSILLPDESTVDFAPNTEILVSENEHREYSLVRGMLTVNMKEQSIDRSGLQVRTLGGLIRGPKAAFTVGVNPVSGDTMVSVSRGVVYANNEKQDLQKQQQQAEEALKLASAGQSQPVIKAEPPAKVDPGKAATLSTSGLVPVAEGQDMSAAAVEKFVSEANTKAMAELSKAAPTLLKAAEDSVAQGTKMLEQTNGIKEANLKLIEELKAARASKEQAKSTELQQAITRNSRLLLALKRQAHLLSLEAWVRYRALDSMQAGADETTKTSLAEKLGALKTSASDLRKKTEGLRPRTKMATITGSRPAAGKAGAVPGAATTIKVPAVRPPAPAAPAAPTTP